MSGKVNKKIVILEFPTEGHADDFCTYWSDGGGEYAYFKGQVEEDITPIVSCDYSQCFEACGYDKKKHGEKRIVFKETSDE